MLASSKFLVIDGHSIAFRAFYALPLLQNKKGEHTNAVYGFATMLMGILEQVNPDYVAAVFDRAAPTFRHIEYEDYKAQREETPHELNEQMSRIKELLEIFNIPVFEKDGYEADDIIGMLVKEAEKKGVENLLLSGDKDLFQLISPSTKVIMLKKGIKDMQKYDLSKLKERYNLAPEQMVDLKALMGDQSDNIPGVPGVGEKTAIKLLQDYQNLDKLLESTDELKGKLKEKIETNKEQALLSRRLVKIESDIEDMDFELEKCFLTPPDYERLSKMFEEQNFKSLMNKIPEEVKGYEEMDCGTSSEVEIKAINDLGQLENIKEALSGKVNVRMLIEPGQGYPRWKFAPWGIAFAIDDYCGYYFHPSLFQTNQWEVVLKSLFANCTSIKLCGHNIKLSMNLLAKLGICETEASFDSMLAAYILDPGRSNLDSISLLEEYLKVKLSGTKIDREGKNAEEFSRSLAKQVTYYKDLQPVMENEISEQGLNELYFNLELPLSVVLSKMEMQGISVNKDILNELSQEVKASIEKLQSEIFKIAGEEFNLNSPQQLSQILFEKLQLPVIKKTKTGYSTDVSVLEELANEYEIASLILNYRQLIKLETTYLSGLMPYIDQDSQKIHTTFNQTVTTTGRLSSSEPNLQNIPVRLEEGRRIRKAFVPSQENYIFLAADYSQIELRILAHLSEDPTLVTAFQNEEDIHQRTAAEIFEKDSSEVTSDMRKKAKAVNFGIVYGISDYGLSQDLKVPRKEAKQYIENYFERYHGVKEYMDNIIEKARKQGFVSTIFNRRRYLPEINEQNFSRRSFGERTARNTPIQGSAADIIKLAMLRIQHRLEENSTRACIMLQVHDELILELPEEEQLLITTIVKEEMENAVELLVPIKVDISYGHNWYDMEKV